VAVFVEHFPSTMHPGLVGVLLALAALQAAASPSPMILRDDVLSLSQQSGLRRMLTREFRWWPPTGSESRPGLVDIQLSPQSIPLTSVWWSSEYFGPLRCGRSGLWRTYLAPVFADVSD
jgi:hypothetical protein